jgi:hypothetical protein
MTAPRLIGLAGRAGTGKSTIARLLCEQHAFVEVAFADPIKRALAAMLDLPSAYFHDPFTKDLPIDWLRNTTPRRLMQTLGTGWGRQMIADDLWLILARRRIERLTAQAEREHIAGIVISDLRYADEAAFVRAQGGTVWHIVRPAPPVEAHSSEAGITAQPGDRTCDNTGDLDRLETTLDHLLHTQFTHHGAGHAHP